MTLRERLEGMLKPGENGLLPCERCGETIAFDKYCGFDGDPAWIVCRSCRYSQPTKPGWSLAVESWNSRPFLRALLLAIEQRDARCTVDSFNEAIGEARQREVDDEENTEILEIIEGKVTT